MQFEGSFKSREGLRRVAQYLKGNFSESVAESAISEIFRQVGRLAKYLQMGALFVIQGESSPIGRAWIHGKNMLTYSYNESVRIHPSLGTE